MRMAVILLMTIASVMMQPASAHRQQLDCIDQVVQDVEVLAHKQLDVTQDGNPDDVIIYGHDELYVLVVVNQPTSNCEVILNDRLTSRQIYNGERRPVTVTDIELVDLTGDNQPELHIGLEGTYFFRQSGLFHAIYKLQDRAMERIFVSDQCLPMSSFEIRTTSDGARIIYRDTDIVCDPPSYHRDYTIYRWDTKTMRFELVESGKIDKTSPDPFWDAFLSVVIVPVVIVIAGVLILAMSIIWHERKKGTKPN